MPQYESKQGVTVATYPDPDESERINGSVRTFGGTERDVNGVYSTEDTAIIDTWWNPNLRNDCHIYIYDMGEYEIITPPENIDRRHQFARFKVRRVEGGEGRI